MHLLDPHASRRQRLLRKQRFRRSATAPREPTRIARFERLEPSTCEELPWFLDDALVAGVHVGDRGRWHIRHNYSMVQ